MNLSRRQFLTTLSASGLGWLLAPAAVFAKGAGNSDRGKCLMLEEVSAGTFSPHVGQDFRMNPAEGTGPGGEVVLFQVSENTSNPRLEQFSAIFQGPKSWLAPQGTYVLENETMGTVTLFMVPILGPDWDHHYYQAVFTRFRNIPAPGNSVVKTEQEGERRV